MGISVKLFYNTAWVKVFGNEQAARTAVMDIMDKVQDFYFLPSFDYNIDIHVKGRSL